MVILEKISKKYSKNIVLKDISLKIKPGSMVGILGGNGCGKSTLLSILAGVQKANCGHFFYAPEAVNTTDSVKLGKRVNVDDYDESWKSVNVDGYDESWKSVNVDGYDESWKSANVDGYDEFANRVVTDLLRNTRTRNELVSYVPQDTPLIEELSAWDNLRMWYSASDLKSQLSDGMLKMLGIDEFIKVPVKKMSGGMKKRLSIGCAINSNPKILLLDEPTAALDLVCKQKIYDYLNYFKNQGGTILLATHEVQEIELCDELYFIKGGSLHSFEYDGNTEKLLSEFTKS